MARRDREALLQALEDPGFTAARRDVPGLVALLSEAPESLVPRIERALLEQPEASSHHLGSALAGTQGGRARQVHALGRLCVAGVAPWSAVHALLDDGDVAVVKAAVGALAQSTSPDTEAALLAAWRRLGERAPLRAMLRALGRVGGEDAASQLEALRVDDPRTVDELARARLMLQRRTQREAPSEILGEVVAPRPLVVDVACRVGLERICADEFSDNYLPSVSGDGRVQVTLRGRLDDLARCRVMTHFSLPLSRRVEGDLARDVTEALCDDEALSLLRAFTRGPLRYRISWSSGGHRRGTTWQIAQSVQARRPELVNDSRDATWEVAVDPSPRGRISLVPRRWKDPRFTWRVAEVPAASHPTLAAALASVAGVRPDDVVWDPFVGSALELIERAQRGPYARMIGTDLDPAALDAARRNLAAAGVARVSLEHRDARVDPPSGVSLIVTNPPYGSRVLFGTDVAPLLTRFVAVAQRALRPGGRLVWIAPDARDTAEAARALGMSARPVTAVLIGGQSLTLQLLTKPGG